MTAVERAAEVLAEHRDWFAAPAGVRCSCGASLPGGKNTHAAHVAAALAAAGLLPAELDGDLVDAATRALMDAMLDATNGGGTARVDTEVLARAVLAVVTPAIEARARAQVATDVCREAWEEGRIAGLEEAAVAVVQIGDKHWDDGALEGLDIASGSLSCMADLAADLHRLTAQPTTDTEEDS